MTGPLPPSSHGTRQPERWIPSRIAAVHRHSAAAGGGGAAERVHLVIARVDGGGASRRISISLARSFESAAAATLASALREHRVELLLSTIPSHRTVCRTTALAAGVDPESSLPSVVEALALLAEAELPASIPPHRRAGGLLGAGPPGSAGAPILLGWPEAAGAAQREEAETAEIIRNVAWVPEIVGLAALARACGGTPTAVCADRGTGAIAVLASADARAVARIARGDVSSPAAWGDSVASIVNSTRSAAGLAPIHGTSAYGPSAEGIHLLDAPAAAPRNITGAQGDAAWRNTYGIPLGAILAWTTEDPAVEPLLALQPQPGNGAGSSTQRLLEWLSAPRRAAAVIAASVALLLLVPLAAAAARATVLERRAGGQAALDERLAIAEREAAFYDLLRARRWPMTKLLADISGAAPIGVRVESVDLSPDLGGPGVTVSAHATSPDLVTTFSRNLAETRILADVATPTITPEGAGFNFRLQARIAAPLFRARPAVDFAEKTLAEHLYGEAAARIDWAALSEDRPLDTRGTATTRRTGRTTDTTSPASGSSSAATNRTTAGIAQPATAPAPLLSSDTSPLTTEQIDAMDRQTATREFAARRQAAARATDEQTRERLNEEVSRLRSRIEALRGGGG